MANADHIIDLLHEAKARPAGGERELFLAEACGDDDALRDQVVSLLEAGDREGDSDILGISRILRPVAPPTGKPGDRIGRYKLLEQIGEGGCGVVYMAEQEEPVRRRVALKVIKLGMDTKQVIARFEAERQALAMMDHPNIAKVLDGGATDAGRPFFVMELVRGIRITDYCDQNNLSTGERLALFTQVCQAVQHAHQKGIIHRDIKPSNILVTLHDHVAVPKVIDFGIAKATTGQLTDKTVFTAFAQFIGTPAYMSPEQAQMSGLDVDTRADIYSLGVLLYELLTGHTPFDARELLASGMDEMRRRIREDEPAKPSTCLSTMGANDLTTVARRRHVEPPKLIHQIRGDLDWLVMKCLEKDRTRRYGTANGLAADIQRHLSNEPITARPPSRWYAFQKTVRRHRFGFAAAAALILVLGLGVLASTWQALRATRAEHEQGRLRQQSETEAAKATAISGFLQQLLLSANPDALKGSEYTVRQLLDDFSTGLENQLQDQPEVEAAVRTTIGRAYRRLGVTDKAQTHHERSLTLRRRIFGEQALPVAESLVDCAWVCFEQNQYTKGEPFVREALEIYRKRGTAGQPVIHALWASQRILIAQLRFAEVEAVFEEALAIARKSPAVEFPEIASMIHGLAGVKNGQSHFAEAESLALKAVAMHRRLRGADHPETAWALSDLGTALSRQQKLPEAETALREALGIFGKYYTFGHKSFDRVMAELKSVLVARGDSAAVEALYRAVLAERGKLGNDNPAAATALHALAGLLVDQGKLSEAEALYGEVLALRRKLLGNDHLDVAECLGSMAVLFRHQPKLAEAEATARENLAICKRLLGDEHTKVSAALHLLAWNLNLRGKHAEAEALSREELAMRKKLLGHEHRDVASTLSDLTRFLRDQAKLAEAEATAREALAIHRKLSGNTNPKTASALKNLAELLNRQGKFADAKTIFLEAAEHANAYDLNGIAFTLATAAAPELRDGPVALTLAEKAVAGTNRKDPTMVDTLASAHAEAGQYAQAIRIQQEAIDLLQDEKQKEDYLTRLKLYESGLPYRNHGQLSAMAMALLDERKPAEAEPLARECLALRERLIPDHWLTFNSRSLLGGSLLGQKKYAEAEPLLLSGYAGMKQREDKISAAGRPRLKESLERLVQLYVATDQTEKAGEWNKTMAEFDRTEAGEKAATPKP